MDNAKVNITNKTERLDCPNCTVIKMLLESTERVRKLQQRIIFLQSYGQEPVEFAKRILEELKMQRKEMYAVMSAVHGIFLERFMNEASDSETHKKKGNSKNKILQDNACNRRPFFIKRSANKNKEKYTV